MRSYIYEIVCLNQDGDRETQGFYLSKKQAENIKLVLDKYPENIKYGITQNVVEHELIK